MSPIGPRHAAAVAALLEWFVTRLRGGAIVWPQNPFVVLPDSEPEPDVALLEPRADHYRRALPEPGDVLLIVEVADATLCYDREVKLPLYAESGVREVWIVDVEHEVREAYRTPGRSGYGSIRRVERGERIAPEALPDAMLSVADILG